MNIVDKMSARGEVSPSFVNLMTGETIKWVQRHNTLSYDASKAMAMAFGGDVTAVPNRVGIIYGANSSPAFQPIGRDQSWEDLQVELSDLNADIQIQSFSYSPSLKQVQRDESGSYGTSVTFHAHTDSSTVGFFGTYFDNAEAVQGEISTSGTYIYQAVLLNKTGDDVKVLARVSLKDGTSYNTKPENFEVALDWSVKFF